jgi:NAD(P)-dependent dehydrogenase (short-subunit alcohol dehydrogenase family)
MDVTEDDFDRTVAVNLKGNVLRQPGGRPGDGRQGGGRIVNMGSQAGRWRYPVSRSTA